MTILKEHLVPGCSHLTAIVGFLVSLLGNAKVDLKLMKIQKFVVGYVLALALLLFAQHRGETVQPSSFREVIDLTHTLPAQASRETGALLEASTRAQNRLSAQSGGFSGRFATRMDAPARLVEGMWTVDQIPAGRLIAPLVVLDASESVKDNPDYEISVADIARWEQANGQLPLGAVVMARTGWGARWNSAQSYPNRDARGIMHFPGYSEDAARFLADGRNALGLGIDTPSIDHGASKEPVVDRYSLGRGLYVLTNVANLDRMPANGAIATVAPMKVAGGSAAPVRILALVR